jgi:hypothetical protein
MLATIWSGVSRLPPVVRNVKVKRYKTIILPLALYGCETWSLKLREEHRLRCEISGSHSGEYEV